MGLFGTTAPMKRAHKKPLGKKFMTTENASAEKKTPFWLKPLWLLVWPFVTVWNGFINHFASYIVGYVKRDSRRIYSIKFVWYGDTIYLHPMIWGSLILYGLAASHVPPGWLLFAWFVGLFVCFMTIMYDFDVVRCATLGVGLVAIFGLAYFATQELAWNPLSEVARHIAWLEASVTPGFYIIATYTFTMVICAEVAWAWLFHRVEIDESYVYEHGFLRGTVREPIFARGLKRETTDLLELLILGAADIQHRTKNGYKRFKNVPFASLWLGNAVDSLLDYRRRGEVSIDEASTDHEDQAKIEHAMDDLDDADDGDDAADPADDDGHDEDMA